MRTTNRSAMLVRAALLVLALTVAATQAGPLPEFTGYTRVGWPPDDINRSDPAVLEKLKSIRPIGVTIYFMVFDQQAEKRGTEGDRWGTGVANFDKTFVSGLNNDRGSLHLDARYLYLYQVVN